MKTEQLIALIAADNRAACEAVRDARRRSAVAVGLSVIAAAAVFLAGFGLRAGLDSGPVLAAVVPKLVATAGALGAGLWLMRRLSAPDAGRTGLGWLVPVAILGVLAGTDLVTTQTADLGRQAIGNSAPFCFIAIILLSALPLAALIGVVGNSAPRRPDLAGAAAGLAAAGLGASIYALHCVEDSWLFVALWYGLAGMVVVAAGAFAGRRVLRW